MAQNEPFPSANDRDDSPMGRVRTRLRYVAYATATIVVTGYCFVLHPAFGLAMTFLAKHVLVAILAAAMKLPIENEKS